MIGKNHWKLAAVQSEGFQQAGIFTLELQRSNNFKAHAKVPNADHGVNIQEVYIPKDKVPDVDIVFVHGLNPINQRNYTTAAWTHPNGTFWPRDILPQDVPNARILVFGYNSNVAFNVSGQSTREHANALLERLSASRTSPQARSRPIIFVGHSLGGLLIKQALVNAKLNWQVYSSIRESTHGLVFFGTPHQGGNGVTLGKIAANIITTIGGKVSNDLLLYLEKDSVLTQNTNDDFRHQVEDYRIVTFFETRKTRLKRSGFLGVYLNTIVVDAKSAKLGVGSREIQLSMDSDHTMMNKFGGRDHMYEPVGGQIGDLVKYCIDEKKRRRQAHVLAAMPVARESDTHFMVPYAYNTAFTGREDIMDRLEDQLSNQSHHQRFALWGLGGVGKTQIALQYAYSVANKCSVFWVHSDSYTRFSRDYREIANRAQLPKNPVAEEELLFEIRKWLESPTSGPWVMILDNADNLLEMFPPVSEDKKPVGLSKFLPQGSKGTILITTRDRVVASRLANMDMLEVRAMGPREAGTLFLRYAPDAISSEEDKAVFPQLLDTLKFLPLAIVGAAAFMRENGVSSTEYFELYSKGKQAQSELLSSEFNDFRRGSEVPEAVLTTYFTLFERLQIQSPMAADFLRLIASFDRNGIQKELLMSSGLEGVDNPVRFTKAIGKLLSFSLMTRGADGNTYQVHRLVHMSIEVYFSEDRVKWRSQAQNTLLKFFQVSPAEELDLSYIDWKGFANYAPHVLAATVQLPSAETPSTVERKLLYQMGRYLYFLGHLADAEIHYRRCISDLPSINTKEELLTDPIFRGYCHLGVVLKIQEKLQESIWLYEEMYERYETILGPSHGCVAGIHCRLITILIKLGTAGLPRAEELSRRVLGLIQESPIANISTIVGSMHILGKVLRLQGKFDDAEKIYQDAVIEAHGRGDDELSLLCVARLVQILQHRKRYNIAEKVLQLAVEMYKTIEIPEAPPTGQITSLTKLANALVKQRKFDQAEEIIRRTVTLYEKRHGPDGLATLTWSGTLSTVLCSQEKYEEAEKFMRHLVTRCEDILGPIHPVTLRNVTNLANVVQETGRYDEAEQLFQRTVEGYEQVFGPDCHTTILCTMWRAVVRAYQGKHSQAVSECMEACEKYKKIYGETQNLKNVMIRVAWFLLRAKELPEGSREPIQGTFDKETAGVALSSYFQNDRSHEEYMFIVVKPGVVMYCEPLD